MAAELEIDHVGRKGHGDHGRTWLDRVVHAARPGTLPEANRPPMTTFADSAAALLASRDEKARTEAWAAFSALGLPTASDEVWRYTPLGELGLERFAVPAAAPVVEPSASAARLARGAGLVLRVVDGFLTPAGDVPVGVSVEADPSGRSLAGVSLTERYAHDAFALLNAALAPATTTVRVAPGVVLDEPIVILGLAGPGGVLPAALSRDRRPGTGRRRGVPRRRP